MTPWIPSLRGVNTPQHVHPPTPTSRRAGIAVVAVAGLVAGLAVAAPASARADVDTLLISTYLEGSSNNKALELYNPTGADADLSGYQLRLFSNGAGSPTSTVDLTGTLPAGGHLVVAHPSAGAELLALADLTSQVTAFNGDDAVQLLADGAIVDSFGQTGTDPGTAWTSGDVTTLNATLLRTGCVSDTDPADAFDPAAQWTAHPIDAFDVLGTFSCDGVGPTPEPTDPGTEPTESPDVTAIGAVQGTTDTSPLAGRRVTVEGTVTGNFQAGGFNGYTIQDAGDGDDATSDGLFVYAPGAAAVAVGDTLRITGEVSEFQGQTQIRGQQVTTVATGAGVEPLELSVPLGNQEAHESMLVTFPDELTIIEYFDFDRYGEIVYGTSRQHTPTAIVDPGRAAQDLLATNLANRLIVDDGRSTQNPSPAIHPDGDPVTAEHYFRGGDTVGNLTGIMSWNFGEWKLQPTEGADWTAVNDRPDVPEVGGTVQVASMNVLNYFTTLTSDDPEARGADTVDEFERQQAKIVAALAGLDADVVGLMEIENNATAVENLVTALNAHLGSGTYSAVATGTLGDDAIIQAIIYRPATVRPAGSWAAHDFGDGLSRPVLAQTFTQRRTGEKFTVAVNHLKSKGSACDGDPDTGDGQGNCNQARVAAAEAMTGWLAGDPTGQGTDRTLIIGDLNSYDHEDPIRAIVGAGYTDLLRKYQGEGAHTYVFDGMTGYLDHALASYELADEVTGAAAWHINADESDLFDYNTDFKAASEVALWSADPYRSSDHDPVLVGLDLRRSTKPVKPGKPTKPVKPGKPAKPGKPGKPKPGRPSTPGHADHHGGGRGAATAC